MSELRTMDLDFILFSFYFLIFLFSFILHRKGQRRQSVTLSQVTWHGHRSGDGEKSVEGSRTR